jgi:shikimate dehydrogenase
VAGRLGLTANVVGFDDPWTGRDWSLLVSTIPARAAEAYAEQLAAGRMTARAVLDVIYHPWPTPLAQAAEQVGAATVSGFELLLHQAARQVELMTGCPAPVEVMRAAGRAALSA